MSANMDGGPAFPVPNDGRSLTTPGMSLRDWFAGELAPSFVTAFCAGHFTPHGNLTAPQQIAKLIFELADAMIAERVEAGAK